MQDQIHVSKSVRKTTKSFTHLKKYCTRNKFPRPLKTTVNGVYTIQYGGKNHLVYKV